MLSKWIAFGVLGVFAPCAAAQGSIRFIGGAAYGLSGDGTTVIGFDDGIGNAKGWWWSATTGRVFLPHSPAAVSWLPFGVSQNGQYVVGWEDGVQAVRWDAAGGMRVLGPVGAIAVSNDGTRIVGVGRQQPVDTTLWRLDGVTIERQVLHAAGTEGQITPDGRVVVSSAVFEGQPAGTREQLFRWTESGGFEQLGWPAGFVDLSVSAVSPDGNVIVGTADAVSDLGFRWKQGVGFELLTGRPGGVKITRGDDTSADGSLVIGSGTSGIVQPVIWQEGGETKLLADFLANDWGIDLAGWTVHGGLNFVSDDGRVIVAHGRNPQGMNGAFIAVAPEPGVAGTMLLLSSIALTGRRRRAVDRTATEAAA